MDDKAFDPYATLGVPSSATQGEITRAYRRRLRDCHPDTRTISPPGIPAADEQLRRILAAYALLRNPDRKAAYDQAAPRARPPSSARPPQSGPVVIPVRHRGRDRQATRTVRVVPIYRQS
jgi:curved DNA-binding protein CbpA